MLKALRNFIIGLLIGAVVFTLVLPYAYFHESPGKFYADLVNGQLRQRQNTIQLARYFDDGGTHLPILNYRTFVDADAEGNPVTPGITLSQFEWQMQTLIDIGCTFITPQDLLDAVARGENLPSRAVMITFDDCNEQIYTQAFPILQKYGIKATVNVIGYYIEYHDNYDQPLLTWDELAEMTASGLVNLQSETYYSMCRSSMSTALRRIRSQSSARARTGTNTGSASPKIFCATTSSSTQNPARCPWHWPILTAIRTTRRARRCRRWGFRSASTASTTSVSISLAATISRICRALR